MTGGPAHKIVGFALVCVAVSTGFIIHMQMKLTDILAAPDWCARAINAEKLAAGRQATSIETCKDLLLKQVGSLALNSHIFAGIIAVCLLVLIVIVVAGAQLRGKVSRDGAEVDISRDAPAAANAVAEAAVDKADEIAGAAP